MRNTYLARRFNGSVLNPTTGPVRTMAITTQTSVGTLNASVLATPALTTSEKSVAIAYLTLFGRSPDRDGLAYWASQVGSSASISTAVNALVGALNGSNILDPDPATSVALVYYHLMGKTFEEDPSGQAYWTSLINSGNSLGSVVQNIVEIISGTSNFAVNTYKNRLLTLESICRIQKDQNYDLSIADSRSAVLRVDGMVSSYTEAMNSIERLLISRIASVPLTWDKTWSSTSLAAAARAYDNSSIIQVRNVVWYNRIGNMMLAKFFLPPNFTSANNHYRVMALHGGGWRQGYPEKIYKYCTALATGTSPSYVVAAPTYRLTAYGHTSPSQEQDVADFYSLLNSATFLRQGSASPRIFGESSGGHLACLLGATQNIPYILALYPPIRLTGNPAVSSGLDVYVDYYAPSTALQNSASVDLIWTGQTTQFQLWHGLGDSFVPSTQSGFLDAVVGPQCNVVYKAGEGHGFTTTTQNEVITAARAFFSN